MFGESVFALIPDHEVRAAKLTNRWISGCWWDATHRRMNTWWVRSSVCLSADQFVGNHLESSGAAVKRSRLEERNRMLMLVWTLEYLDHPWYHVEMKRCHLATVQREIPTVPPPAPPPQPGSDVPEIRGQGVHAKALRIRAFWSEIGRTSGCPACETSRSGEVTHTGMQSASRCLRRESSNCSRGGGEARSR